MKYVIYPNIEKLKKKEIVCKIENEAFKLHEKLKTIDVHKLEISDYNKKYLIHYIDNYRFYIQIYTRVLLIGISRLNKSIESSTFIDYGGGCGVFSYLAKSVGFGKVIYNDIYDMSVKDAKVIAEALKIEIDHFVHGDIQELVEYIRLKDITLDLICSFDVIEHIYDLDAWYDCVLEPGGQFVIVFASGANGSNWMIRRKLQKLHRKSEIIGEEKYWGWKERDAVKPFIEIRKGIIKELDSTLSTEVVDFLASATRGLMKKDIADVVLEYKNYGKISYKIQHPTNTCDPNTGNWTERIIDLKEIEKSLKEKKYKVTIFSGFYTYSRKTLIRIAKYILNIFIHILGRRGLFLSPYYILISEINLKE